MAFLQISGTNFVLNGKKYIPFGGSTYDISGGNTAVDQHVSDALAMGMNMFRCVNYLGVSGTSGYEFTETQWKIIDYALAQARIYGMKIHLDLSDVFGSLSARWSGHTADGFYTDFQAFCTWLGARVNTVNGQAYSTDDALGIIAICGEISLLTPTTATQLYNGVGGYLQTSFPNTPITSGGQVLSIMPTIIALPNIDCVSLHDYDGDSAQETDFPQILAMAQSNNKPWFLEEFGAAQNNNTDIGRANYFARVYRRALRFGCAAFLFWNIDEGVGGGYGVSPLVPECAKVVKTYSSVLSYSPRIPVKTS